MKKLFIGCFLALISASLFAQEIKIAPVFGLHAAGTIYSREIKNDFDGEKNRPIPGITIGALGDYQLFDNLSVRSGLLLSLKGGNMKYKEKDGGYTLKYNQKHLLTYLELPLWVSYPLAETGFSLTGGPTIGFALAGKVKSKINEDGDIDKDEYRMNIGNDASYDDVKPIDVSLNLGIAKQIDIADKTIEVSFHIQPSLTKWNTESKVYNGYWARNIVVGLRAAYFFSLSR